MGKELSIIVPVYNVESFLPKCLDSILHQPYKNYELILVDDGSTDNSDVICDEYAKRDNRVRVIHKENGGLSSARNAGLDICRGKYISFIDSDDYLDGDIYTEAIERMENDAEIDVVWLNYYSIYEDGRKEIHQNTKDYYVKKSDNSSLYQFVNNEALAWLKIYRSRVFGGIRYPEGRILEDLYIVPDLFDVVNKIYVSKIGFIAYRQRFGSICHKKHTSNMIGDIASSYARILKLLKDHDRKMYIRSLATYSSGYLNTFVLFPDIHYPELKKQYESFTYAWSEIFVSSINFGQKIKLLLLKLFGYNQLSKFYKFIYIIKHR